MALSTIGFTTNDAIPKGVSEALNAGEMMLVRGVFASSLIALIAWRAKAFSDPRRLFHPLVLVRAAGEAGGTVCFLPALSQMPLANVSAVIQALPLAVTVAAGLCLGEPVGIRRWSAIAIGFFGVVFIVRPGTEGFNAYSLFALGTVFFCTIRDLATRRLSHEIPTLM